MARDHVEREHELTRGRYARPWQVMAADQADGHPGGSPAGGRNAFRPLGSTSTVEAGCGRLRPEKSGAPPDSITHRRPYNHILASMRARHSRISVLVRKGFICRRLQDQCSGFSTTTARYCASQLKYDIECRAAPCQSCRASCGCDSVGRMLAARARFLVLSCSMTKRNSLAPVPWEGRSGKGGVEAGMYSGLCLYGEPPEPPILCCPAHNTRNQQSALIIS